VHYRDSGAHASIHHILPRKSFRDENTGKNIEFQMIAANIDVAFIVQSCHFDFNVRRLERYSRDERRSIEPLLLLTKTDLISPEALEQLSKRSVTRE
jgi:ribosome biogenesis GTPase